MGRADFCEHGCDAAFAHALPMWFGAVAPVALHDLRFVQGATPLAANVWNCRDQRVKLRDVVAVRAGQDDRERDALRVDDEVVLAAELAPVRRVRTGFFPPTLHERMSCRRWHAPGRPGRDDEAPPAMSRGRVARLPPPAMRPAVASKQCPSHSPSLAAASSTRCLSAAQTRCR